VIPLRIAQLRRTAAAALLALGVTGTALAQRGYGRTADYETLPVGTVLKVRLDQRLNSAQARTGQRFTATVQPDEDGSGLPEGTKIEGVVREARAATRSQPGVLDVDFTTLETPDGHGYSVRGALASLDKNSVTRTANGRLVARQTSSRDRTKFIGYGAGAGALIGVLTGGNLLKGALLGAAGGYLYGQLNKDKTRRGFSNVDLREGAEFGVRLEQRFAWVPVGDERLDRSDEELSRRARGDSSVTGRRDRRYDTDRSDATFRDRSDVTVFVEERRVSFGSALPMREGQTVLVPLAPVMSAAGVRYYYNPLTREISINGDQRSVRATVGGTVATLNSERVRLEEPIRRIGDTLHVPERFLELATGMQATWDASGQTLRLNGRGLLNRDRYRNDRSTPF